MTDEQAKTLARALVEETLREAGRKDVAIHRVYLIPERKLYVVVMIFGQTLRVGFQVEELTGGGDQARHMARRLSISTTP